MKYTSTCLASSQEECIRVDSVELAAQACVQEQPTSVSPPVGVFSFWRRLWSLFPCLACREPARACESLRRSPRTCVSSRSVQANGYAIRIVHMYLIRVVTSVGQVLLVVVPLDLGPSTEPLGISSLLHSPLHVTLPLFARICAPIFPRFTMPFPFQCLDRHV